MGKVFQNGSPEVIDYDGKKVWATYDATSNTVTYSEVPPTPKKRPRK
jgi:hypothetical protein